MIDQFEFICGVFDTDKGTQPGEIIVATWQTRFTDRDTGEEVTPWLSRAYTGRVPEDKATYYCVSTFRDNGRDQKKRDKAHALRAFVLPCDDVGTKALPPPVEPSYKLETSEGNFQYGYFIEPFDVADPEGAAYYDGCLLGLAEAGFNDFGCRNATRVMRLPGSLHRTGFKARITEWHPERRWMLEDLMAKMGVKPADVKARSGTRKPGKHQAIEDVDDPILDWLVKQGLARHTREHWVHVQCPWHEEHSKGTDDEAGYSPLDFMTKGRGFHCFHSHSYTLQDFLAWVIDQGGPSPELTYRRMRILEECTRST
jgi:hypothetical protein